MVLGYLVWSVGIADLVELIHRLVRLNKPIALFDERGTTDFSHILSRYKNVRVFSMANNAPSLLISRFLLRLRHRHVAYISPFHKMAWSQNRLEGIEEAFSESGSRVSVTPFTLNQFRFPYEYIDQVEQEIGKVRSDKVFDRTSPVYTRLDRYSIVRLTRQLRNTVTENEIRRGLMPLFEKALRDKKITAWICTNDETALYALEFLRHNNIAVPQQISVIGFDDTFEAFGKGLTSYNFNISAIVTAMMTHVIAPGTPNLHKKQRIIELDGMIVERQTTGIAHTSKQSADSHSQQQENFI
jgi:DNA-binding LacI/PurR family transcriptional regulator